MASASLWAADIGDFPRLALVGISVVSRTVSGAITTPIVHAVSGRRGLGMAEIACHEGAAGTVDAMQTAIHQALGLTDAEAAIISRLLGREHNHLELAMYAVMWSEHCSYKSSKVHL